MSFKVIYRNLEIVCENVEDIDRIADRQESLSKAKARNVTPLLVNVPQTSNPTLASSVSGIKTEEELFRLFLEGLTDKPLELLNALADKPSGIVDTELRTLLDTESKNVFSGWMSVLGKKAVKLGLDYQTIVVKTALNKKRGEKTVLYRLSNEFREVMLREREVS